jgi:hypothetical protein
VLTEGLTDLDKLIEKERLVLVKHDTSLGGSGSISPLSLSLFHFT